MRRCATPAALSAGVHSRERQLLMSMRPPPAAGNRMPSRSGIVWSAAITLRRIGTRRRETRGLRVRLQLPLRERAPDREGARLQVDVGPVGAEGLFGPHAGAHIEDRDRYERAELGRDGVDLVPVVE